MISFHLHYDLATVMELPKTLILATKSEFIGAHSLLRGPCGLWVLGRSCEIQACRVLKAPIHLPSSACYIAIHCPASEPRECYYAVTILIRQEAFDILLT